MNKKLLVIGAVLSMVVIAVVTKPNSKGLELADCQFGQLANTRVHFFVDEALLQTMTSQQITNNLENAIKYANQILENSCVPMTRSLGKIEFVAIEVQQIDGINDLRKLVKGKLDAQENAWPQRTEHDFYGFVFDKQYESLLGLSGQASPYFGSWFFAISSGAQPHILEHELGHLAWAHHREQHPVMNLTLFLKSAVPAQYHHKLVPYARATKCGDSGTIMSYEPKIIPIYSSPDIRYQDQVCGDSERADNARVLREFAQRLMVRQSNSLSLN